MGRVSRPRPRSKAKSTSRPRSTIDSRIEWGTEWIGSRKRCTQRRRLRTHVGEDDLSFEAGGARVNGSGAVLRVTSLTCSKRPFCCVSSHVVLEAEALRRQNGTVSIDVVDAA